MSSTRRTNVILLGAAFHLIFFSFQTSVFIQQTVVNSIKAKPEYNFNADGYVSLCITYTVFALSNWLAPSIISLTGSKLGMFLGSITYVLYSASFIYPTTALFYAAAALIGLGAGPLWTAQGSYLAKNSDSTTSSRDAGIFWSMLQSSLLLGNLFVYLAFNDQVEISDNVRYAVYGVLTLVCACGSVVILCLRDSTTHTTGECGSVEAQEEVTAFGQFTGALKLAKSPNMILLSLAFLFTGQFLSFFTGVYGTAIGATTQFGADSKKYIGLAGILIGIGEIFGGSIFGLLGVRVGKLVKRDTVFVIGYIVTLFALALIFINLPPDSPQNSRAQDIAIIEPRIWVIMLSSLLVGVGDACFNTQIYSLLMSVYTSHSSVAAFALFKFVQSLGSAVAFLYSTKLNLYYQLSLLAVISTAATLCFCLVEWKCRSAADSSIAKSESKQHIVKEAIKSGKQRNYGVLVVASGRTPNGAEKKGSKSDTVIRIN